MTLRQTIQAAAGKTAELITKLSATSNQAVKTREGLLHQLSDELTRYVEIEEQNFLPLLRKNPETKDFAVEALKGNKQLRASLEKLTVTPIDSDAFLEELRHLEKSVRQHLRDERKELLPAVLKALSDEEAGALANTIDGALADADKAKRDEKREEAAAAKREEEEAQQAAADKRKEKRDETAAAKREAVEVEEAAVAKRAETRAQNAVERASREAVEKSVETAARSVAAAQDGAQRMIAQTGARTAKASSDAMAAFTVDTRASQKMMDDLQAVRDASTASVGGMSEIYSACVEWFGSAARLNADASRRMMQCRSMQQAAEIQKEFATISMRNWMEGNVKVLKIAQRASKQAIGPLDDRLGDTA